MLDTSKIITEVPLLSEIQISNAPLPLWHSHWGGLVKIAFDIRQHIARPIKKGGLDLTLSQNENTKRGVETIQGLVSYKKFIQPQRTAGIEAYISRLCTLINLKTLGSKPIEKLRLARTQQKHLLYYGAFYNNQMEIVIYIGSGEDINGATVVHLKRSYVDETTRDWNLLAEQIPQTVWVKV